MQERNKHFTSGVWTVKPDKEEEFVSRWSAFAKWAKEHLPGSVSVILIQSAANPLRFISTGEWKNQEAIDSWRRLPEFKEQMSQLRALCDDAQAGDYNLRANF